MIVVREQTTQMKPPTTECRRMRAGRAFAQLAEKKPDSTLKCQFTKTGDYTNYDAGESPRVASYGQ